MSQLRVETISLREIRLPLRERFEISSGWEEERRVFLLELVHPEGPSVWSECVAGAMPNYSPETIDTSWLAVRDWLAPRVVGRPFDGPSVVSAFLEMGVRGHRMAKAALEMGLWAMAAELEGVSLARRLGGERSHVETGISLGIQPSPDALAEKASEAQAQGYRKVKLKIRPGADLEFVRAVREALGPAAAVAVDANAAYTLDDTPALRELDPFELMMLEQPLASGDLRRHAELQKAIETPICIDESVTDVATAEDMISLGSGRIINIKPGRVGGFTPSVAIHDLSADAEIPVWCGGMLESGVGRAYNVALATLPNFRLPGDLSPSRRYWERDIVEPEWTMSDDGLVPVPIDRPGLGVRIDRDRIEDLTVRSETVGLEPASRASG